MGNLKRSLRLTALSPMFRNADLPVRFVRARHRLVDNSQDHPAIPDVPDCAHSLPSFIGARTFLAFLVALSMPLCAALMTGCAARSSAPSSPSAVAPVAPALEPAPTPAAPADPPAPSDTDIPLIKLPAGAAKPPAPFEGAGWEDLFDGHTLEGWKETLFAGRGGVHCQDGLIILNMGDPFTGINYTNEFPKMNYEIALDAMRVSGSDFFCGLTVPVGESHCSLVAGGWGGSLFGISSLDGMDASENETTKYVTFEQGKWYRLRLRVTEKRIEVWVDDDKLINVITTDRKLSVRPGDIELSKPMGIAAWQTTAALREIKVRKVDAPAGPPPKGF